MLKQFLFETGPEGTDLSIANSGASQYAKNGGTAKFAAAAKSSGSFGAQFVVGTGGSMCVGVYDMDAANTQVSFSGVITIPSAFPSAAISTLSLNNAARGILTLGLDNAGGLQIYSTQNSTAYRISTDGVNSAATQYHVTPGSKYRVTLVAKAGASTGSFTAKLYAEKGSTVLGFCTISGINMAADPFTTIQLGITSAGPAGTTIGWDDIQLDSGSGTELPRVPETLPAPSLSATKTDPSVVGGNGTVTVTAGPSAGATRVRVGLLSGSVTTGTPSTQIDLPASGGSHVFTVSAGTYTPTAIAE